MLRRVFHFAPQVPALSIYKRAIAALLTLPFLCAALSPCPPTNTAELRTGNASTLGAQDLRVERTSHGVEAHGPNGERHGAALVHNGAENTGSPPTLTAPCPCGCGEGGARASRVAPNLDPSLTPALQLAALPEPLLFAPSAPLRHARPALTLRDPVPIKQSSLPPLEARRSPERPRSCPLHLAPSQARRRNGHELSLSKVMHATAPHLGRGRAARTSSPRCWERKP